MCNIYRNLSYDKIVVRSLVCLDETSLDHNPAYSLNPNLYRVLKRVKQNADLLHHIVKAEDHICTLLVLTYIAQAIHTFSGGVCSMLCVLGLISGINATSLTWRFAWHTTVPVVIFLSKKLWGNDCNCHTRARKVTDSLLSEGCGTIDLQFPLLLAVAYPPGFTFAHKPLLVQFAGPLALSLLSLAVTPLIILLIPLKDGYRTSRGATIEPESQQIVIRRTSYHDLISESMGNVRKRMQCRRKTGNS